PFAETEIGIEEGAAGTQHARDFGQETRKLRVTVRSLDIEHGVKGFVGERKLLSVALHKSKMVEAMALAAERDACRIQIEAGVVRGPQCTRNPRGAAAMAAAHF